MDIEKIEEKVKKNESKIEQNKERIHQNTGALEILKTFKSDSKKFFIMWIITFIALLGSLLYIIYLLRDTSYVETTQEITDVDSIGGNVLNNGDIYGENKTDH